MNNTGDFVITGSGSLAWSVEPTHELYKARGQIIAVSLPFFPTLTASVPIFPSVKWESHVYLAGLAEP